MISSKAVYVDRDGNHSNSATKPRFDGPISETQPTMAPGSGDYMSREGYGANKVAAEQVLLDSGCPVTVLRPSKIHGPGSRQPREWVFVKRVLDRRPAVFLAHRGAGVDHTTAAANIAALIEVAAESPGARVLNSADPDAPSALEIARTIARQLDHSWQRCSSTTRPPTAWAARPGTRRTRSSSTRPRRSSSVTCPQATMRRRSRTWSTGSSTAAQGGEGSDLLPAPDDEYFGPLLDYPAEDRRLGLG